MAAEWPCCGVLAQLYNATGIEFAHYKRATVLRRIGAAVMQVNARTTCSISLAYSAVTFLKSQAAAGPDHISCRGDQLFSVTPRGPRSGW